MHRPRRLGFKASIILCFVLQALGADKYTDENRPYEFGFKIDGEQHRHESKDKDGIIMGEFGFVTADDVYHVTVYATDKEGHFKILSMKNIHLKSSSTSGLGTPTSARQGHALALPSAQPASVQASAVPQQQIKQGGAPSQPQQGLFAPQAPVPQGAFAPQVPVPQKAFVPQPGKQNKPVTIEQPGKSCSSCSLPTTTTRPPPPAYNQVADKNNYNSPKQFSAPAASPQNQHTFPASSPGQQNIEQGGPIASTYNPQGGQEKYPSVQQNIPQQGLIATGGVPSFAPQPSQTPQNYVNSPNLQKPSSPNTYLQPGEGSFPSAGQARGGAETQARLGQTYSGEQNRFFTDNPYAGAGPKGSATTVPAGGNFANGQQSGSPGQISYPQRSPAQGFFPPRSPAQSSFPPESPAQGSFPPGSSAQGSVPQGSPTQGSISPGTPTQGFFPPRAPAQSSFPPGSPAQGSYPQGSPAQSSFPPGSSAQGSYPHGSPAQGSISSGSPAQGSFPPGSPAQGSIPQGSPVQGSFPPGSPAQGSYPQGGAGERTAKQYNGPRQQSDSQQGPNGFRGPGAVQGSNKPTLVSAQMQIVDQNTDIYALGPNEQKGLPPGLAQGDINTLLYTFNYTVGFHGHFEEGYTNGAKKGYYFVTGRNGVRTRIDYVADDTGFHPTVSQEVLDLLSEDVPKPETEKDAKYGLKGYEFKWLYYPAESK